MQNIFILILFTLLVSCKGLNQHNMNQIHNEMEIDFQDFFNEDRISVRINDCIIIENGVINSNQIIGYTGLRLKLINPNIVSYREEQKSLICNFNLKTKINVMINLNGNEILFEIDLRRGHFIGFDKRDEQLLFSQSKEPFQYD